VFDIAQELNRFGKRIGVKKPAEIIQQVVDNVTDTLLHHKDLLQVYPLIQKAIHQAVSRCMN
jgi:hypothetical protein